MANYGGSGGGGAGNSHHDTTTNVMVFRVRLRCGRCPGRIIHLLGNIDGVDSVKIDDGYMTIAVVGKVNPLRLRQKVEDDTKRKVKIVGHSGDDTQMTTVLEVGPLRCAGCPRRLIKLVHGDGVEKVTMTDGELTITVVTGHMDPVTVKTKIEEHLKNKVHHSSETIRSENRDKKTQLKQSPDKPPLKDIIMEEPPATFPVSEDGDASSSSSSSGMPELGSHHCPGLIHFLRPGCEPYGHAPQGLGSYPPYGVGVDHDRGGSFEQLETQSPSYYDENHHVHAPQLFSDENPRACLVM